MSADGVGVFEELLRSLACGLESASTDGSHDLSHLRRVWRNAAMIAAEEGGSLRNLAAAVILHDCVPVEKDSPVRAQASRRSAEKAGALLRQLEWDALDCQVVTDAILSHSYSAGLPPKTLEGLILQDADRLDGIGSIGIARCFYTAGRLGSQLYDPLDPQALNRETDDKRYALDHFPAKLLKVTAGFQTRTGARMAQERHAHLQEFYDRFLEEVGA